MQTQVKISTWDSYRRNLQNHVLPALGGTQLQQLTAGHLNSLYRSLIGQGRWNGAGGLSPKTVAELYGATTMTPRIAYWLWSTAIYLADTWSGASDDPQLLREWLPPIARPLAHGACLEQFIGCLDALADRIATGTTGVDGLSCCTGEEMALHLIIDLAEAHFDDDILGPEIGDAPRLPNRGDADENFDLMRDVLFKDNDVLMLNDPMLDGIDDAESDLARIERTVNLHPRDWFRPFAG